MNQQTVRRRPAGPIEHRRGDRAQDIGFRWPAILIWIGVAAFSPTGLYAQTLCPSDCSGNLVVSIDELIACATVALGKVQPDRCPGCDIDLDGTVTVDEVVRGVSASLRGCGFFMATPTAMAPSPTATPTVGSGSLVEGVCRRPGLKGSADLAPCPEGGRVSIAQCRSLASCLRNGDVVVLDFGFLGADGAFTLSLDKVDPNGGPLVFDAVVDPGGEATVYRTIDFGNIAGAKSAAFTAGEKWALRYPLAVGRGAGAEPSSTTVLVDPSSEGATRAIDRAGLEKVAAADATTLNRFDLAAQTRATLTLSLAGTSPAEAADLAGEAAFEQFFIDPRAIVVSPDGAHTYMVGNDSIAAFRRNPKDGALEFLSVLRNGFGGVDGLIDPRDLTISTDGLFLYAVTSQEDQSVTTFRRDPETGNLEFLDVYRNALIGPEALVPSPDGNFLYMAGFRFGLLFRRDADSGLVTPSSPIVYPEGMRFGVAVATSPDGSYLYLSGQNFLVVYERDPVDGTLSVLQTLHGGDGEISGILEATNDNAEFDIAVSPDGGHVYLLSLEENSIGVFRSDPIDGRLSVVEVVEGVPSPFPGSFSLGSIVPSSDGGQVYATNFFENTISVYDRDSESGRLTLVQTNKGIRGRVAALALSPDGTSLYAGGENSKSIAAFVRNPDGPLEFQDEYRAFIVRRFGLDGARSAVLSPDARNVYVVSFTSDRALTVFLRDPATGLLTHLQTIPNVDAFGDSVVAVSRDGANVYTGRDRGLLVLHRSASNGSLTVSNFNELAVSSVSAVIIAPDDRHVYAASDVRSSSAVTVFVRRVEDGSLVLQQQFPFEFERIDSLAISPDGKHLYAVNTDDTAVVSLERDDVTGELRAIQTLRESDLGGVRFPQGIAVSPDGESVYVAAPQLIKLGRDTTTGMLTFLGEEEEPLGATTSVRVSADNRHVYVTSEATFSLVSSSSIAVYERLGVESLSFVEMIRDDEGGVEALRRAGSIALTPDGTNAYVPAAADDALSVFERDPATGRLTILEVQR